MQPGNFVKWTSEDTEGKFSHIGELLSIDDETVKMRVAFGVIEFPRKDGEVKVTKKIELTPVASFTAEEIAQFAPAGGEKPKADVVEKTKVVRAKRSTGDGPSRQDQVVAIVKANPKSTRKELIQMVVDQIGMTPAGASTYIYNAQQLLKNETK